MDLSVVIITYERIVTLQRTIEVIRPALEAGGISYQLIVADDNSSQPVKSVIRRLPADKRILARQNGGMGANFNRGLNAAEGDYILQLQDDWVYTGQPGLFRVVMEFMGVHPDIGVVNFNREKNISPLRVIEFKGLRFRIFENIPLDESATVTRYPYTDNPHLKSRKFVSALGAYSENRDMRKVEKEFCERVAAQNEYFIADFDRDSFSHIGEQYSFNPGYRMDKLKKDLLKNPLTRIPVGFFLKFKKYLASRVSFELLSQLKKALPGKKPL